MRNSPEKMNCAIETLIEVDSPLFDKRIVEESMSDDINYKSMDVFEVATTEENMIVMTKSKGSSNKPDFSHVQVHKTKSKTLLTGSADLFIFNEPCSEVKKKPQSILTQIPTRFEDVHEDEKTIDNIFLKQQEAEIIPHPTKIIKNKSVLHKPVQIKEPSVEKPNNLIIVTLLFFIVVNVIFILQEINVLDFKKMGSQFNAVHQTAFVATKQTNDLMQHSETLSQKQNSLIIINAKSTKVK